MNLGVIGLGATGARAARQLLASGTVENLDVRDADGERQQAVLAALGDPAGEGLEAEALDVAVVATAGGGQADLAADLVRHGVHVVTTTDAVDDVLALEDLGREAEARGVTVVVGAGFSPGLTCVLAVHASSPFDVVEEVHVAKVGTGGPACARQHHRALSKPALDWREGGWVRRRGGSGRELCWFPDPVGPEDCYRAALPDALLLRPAFPSAQRLTSRVAANRRDRFTARLPMLRRPHPEGGPGAVRVEVRGQRDGVPAERVLGVMDRPAVAAGAVAAQAALWVAEGRIDRPGSHGLAALVDPVPFLAGLADRGVRAAVFEGSGAASPW